MLQINKKFKLIFILKKRTFKANFIEINNDKKYVKKEFC